MSPIVQTSRMGPILLFLTALLLVLWPDGPALRAEVIYLKNGQVIAGKVIGQSRTTMRIQTPTGVRTIQKTSIRRVSYSAAEEQRIIRQQTEARRQREEAEAAPQAEQDRAAREEAERLDAEANADAGEESTGAPDDITPGGYVLRSAVVPGWGHLAMGKTWTGVAYMGLGGLAFLNMVTSRSAALAAESQNADDVLFNFALSFAPEGVGATERIVTNLVRNSRAQGPYRDAIDRYDQSLGLLGAVYLIQLGHIIYDAYYGGAPEQTGQQTAGPRDPGFRFDLAPRRMASDRLTRARDSDLEWRGQLEYTISF